MQSHSIGTLSICFIRQRHHSKTTARPCRETSDDHCDRPRLFVRSSSTRCLFCREREEQRQTKHASADHNKPKKESAAEAAAQQPAQAAVAVLATDVEDSQLPGAAMQPPAADPVGKGLLTPQQISGSAAIPCCEQFLAQCCGYFLGRCCGYFFGRCCKHFLERWATVCMKIGSTIDCQLLPRHVAHLSVDAAVTCVTRGTSSIALLAPSAAGSFVPMVYDMFTAC